MPDIVADYKIPTEVQHFVDSGFLEVSSENPAEKTVQFYIPSMEWKDEAGREIGFTLLWIHPDFNAQFCHFSEEVPGDLANFYLFKETVGDADEQIDVPTLDDLEAWLRDRQDER